MDQLILTKPPRQVSRDEMNLAEFPLAVLSTRADPTVKTLEFRDQIRNKNGELVERKWIITGADKFGLPTASDDEVLLGLLKLTVDDGFRAQKVYFTRYELLRILRWTTEGRSYVRLQKALDRLSGVRIKASNAFYDNEAKSHSTRNFGILDAYEINDGRDTNPKPSFFIWSETIFKSFQAGFIKKLDLDFYLTLESAISKRLYRYLDKHFWYKSTAQTNLFILAHEKIGISRNYRYASSIRQQLDPAISELIEKGFLSGCEYVGKGQGTEIVLFAARKKPRSQEHAEPALGTERASKPMLDPAGDDQLRGRLQEALVSRGLKEQQVEKLLDGRSVALLRKMAEIVDYYDSLMSGGSQLISRSPVGFLYRAIEKAESFILPGKRPGNFVQAELFQRPAKSKNSGEYHSPDKTSRDALQSEYLVDRRQLISQIRVEAEPHLLDKMKQEVEKGLGKLKGLISEARFEAAIEHGVDEKLAKLFAVPDFNEWLRSRKQVVH